MAANPRLLFLTDRGERHQRTALQAAPKGVDLIIKRHPSFEQLIDILPTIDFIISERSEPVTASMITTAKRLKLIVRLGALGYDIDLPAARAAGIRVSVQPVFGSIYAAEHALMMILAVLKRLGRSLSAANAAEHSLPAHRTDEDTFAFNWLNYKDIDGLFGKTVSIVGMGDIGVELTRRLTAFRVKAIYYHKRTPYPAAVEQELGLTYATQMECVRQADILVSLLPFSAETDRSIHAGTFEIMKSGAILVHLGSGSVIDEQALVAALRDGKLTGTALDTYEYEPLQPTHTLVALARNPASNLLLTPHTAAASLRTDRSDDYAEFVRFLAGETLCYEIH